MCYVSTIAAKQVLAEALDGAQRGPVTIRQQKRDVAVVLPIAEYENLTCLNFDEFQRFCDVVGERAAARGLTEKKLADMLAHG